VRFKATAFTIFRFRFFREKLRLVPIDMPWDDFGYSRKFVELFLFVLGSTKYSPPVRRDSSEFSSPGSRPIVVYKQTRRCHMHRGVVTTRCIHTGDSLPLSLLLSLPLSIPLFLPLSLALLLSLLPLSIPLSLPQFPPLSLPPIN
jgi:hypothetical protein